MTIFVQHNNGKIRRERNAFGGSTAWRQHYEGPMGDYYGSSRRSKLIEEIQAQLAAEQLRDIVKNGYLVRPQEDTAGQRSKRRGGRNRNRHSRYDNTRFET